MKDRALAVLAGKDDAALLECVWALNFDVKKALFHTPCRIAIQDDLVLFGYPDGSLMQRKKHVLIYDSLATIQDVESDKFCSVM